MNDVLRAKLLSLNIPLSRLDPLLLYIQLLSEYSKKLNLVSYKDDKELVDRHILDSLALYPYISEAGGVIDFGTGAGLPGMVLAIVDPERDFYLIDSRTKRISFLDLVILEML